MFTILTENSFLLIKERKTVRLMPNHMLKGGRMMGISELIKEVKKDKEKFELLVCEMEPLIRKYVKNL